MASNTMEELKDHRQSVCQKSCKCITNFATVLLSSTSKDDNKMGLQKLAKHAIAIRAWTIFIMAAIALLYLFSSGDFSLMMTLASMVSLFSFVLVALHVYHEKSISGISLQMFIGYSVLFAARLTSILSFTGYLPYDKSGDGLYQTIEVLNFVLSAAIVIYGFTLARKTYSNADTFRIYWILIPTLLIACVLHPNLNDFKPTDIAWSFALYSEAVIAIPQFFLWQNEKKIDVVTTHFLAAQVFSKVCVFAFWVASWHELNDESHILKRYVGYWVMLVQILQIVVAGDFLYHYGRCWLKGESVQTIVDDASQ
eukprot:Platyproteum_vivax@DN636_c0_g1_i1.p1